MTTENYQPVEGTLSAGNILVGATCGRPPTKQNARTDAALPTLHFNEQGLIPAIVQDADDGTVLMMAWMSPESLSRTLTTGQTWFWSRSRTRLWHKGEESGNTQEVVSLSYDCDGDTLLVHVHPQGAGVACHTGERSCFYRTIPLDTKDEGSANA